VNYAVLIDFGSTFTKVAAVSLREHRLLFASKFASTVKTDARVGLSQCLDAAKEAIGDKAFEDAYKLASSSAAGGLRMTVIGLTQSLSITAGRNAAFGAGAKIMRTLHGKLTAADADAILAAQTEIVLFCGGYENGNVSTVLHNAKILAESASPCPHHLRRQQLYRAGSPQDFDSRRARVLYRQQCDPGGGSIGCRDGGSRHPRYFL
jgi:hypothetical protein